MKNTEDMEFTSFRDRNGEVHLINVSEIDYITFSADGRRCTITFRHSNTLELSIESPGSLGSALTSGSATIINDLPELTKSDLRTISHEEAMMAFTLMENHLRKRIHLTEYEVESINHLQNIEANRQKEEVWKIDLIKSLYDSNFPFD